MRQQKILDQRKKQEIFRNCASFTDCKSEINKTQKKNSKGLDVVMLMYNLIDYKNNCHETSGNLWQYYRDGTFIAA